MKYQCIILVVACALGGCVNSQLLDAAKMAEVGPPPGRDEILGDAQTCIGEHLKDPDSAEYYMVGQPYRAMLGTAFNGGIAWNGWAVDLDVNAKNAFGGYTGKSRYTLLTMPDHHCWDHLLAEDYGTPADEDPLFHKL